MLKYAVIFAIISLITGALCLGGMADSTGIARILSGLLLVLTVIFVMLAGLGLGPVKKAMN